MGFYEIDSGWFASWAQPGEAQWARAPSEITEALRRPFQYYFLTPFGAGADSAGQRICLMITPERDTNVSMSLVGRTAPFLTIDAS